jgi:hypothetical protein
MYMQKMCNYFEMTINMLNIYYKIKNKVRIVYNKNQFESYLLFQQYHHVLSVRSLSFICHSFCHRFNLALLSL